eukprot:3003398-Amphidinium_carterae.2
MSCSQKLFCLGIDHGISLGRVTGSETTHLGSRDSQNQSSKCIQELRLEHSGEENQISQRGQSVSVVNVNKLSLVLRTVVDCPKLGNTREESWRIQIQSK